MPKVKLTSQAPVVDDGNASMVVNVIENKSEFFKKEINGVKELVNFLQDTTMIRHFETQMYAAIISTMPKRFIKKLGHFSFTFSTIENKNIISKFYGVEEKEMKKIKKHMVKNSQWFAPLIQNILSVQEESFNFTGIENIDFNSRWLL